MKIILVSAMAATLVFTGCRGAGERTGAAVDHGADKAKAGAKASARTVGHGFQKAGDKLEDAGR